MEPGTHLPKENDYALSVYLDGEEFPLHFRAELVNITFGLAGIKFVAYDGDTEFRFDALLEMLSSEVDCAMADHEKYQRQLSESFHREG
jgi:translation elongation factor EF-1beta